MNYTVGIDLGSTTTKAVILDEEGAVVGRGITNSRSSYDVACQVALTEALIDTRFSIVAAVLNGATVGGRRRREALADLERGFRREQYLAQLRRLGATIERLCLAGGHGAAESDAAARILKAMEKDAETLFAPGSSRKSDFFRDLAGATYLRLAEEEARSGGPGFEPLVGLYDKAILEVENTPPEAESFGDHALAAADATDGAIPQLRAAVKWAARVELRQISCVGTGYGRQRLPFPKKQIRSEILCHGLGAHTLFPRSRTVLDIGGQDTKAIQLDEEGLVTSFQMNDRCAAGCGRYLGYIADEMNLGLHELGPLASRSCRPASINSTCTVFAGAEIRQRLSLGEKREDILAGLHRAIILRALSLLARSGGVRDEFTFTGGVARNPAAVNALEELVSESYGDVTLNISSDSIYTGALGAALFARRALTESDASPPRRDDPEVP